MMMALMLVLPSLVSGLALLLYFVTIASVSWGRVHFKIEAPATSGHPVFERLFRIQQNTQEQLVLFLPSLWLYCFFASPRWGAIIGAVWLAARIYYVAGYVRAAKRRAPGFVIAAIASVTLLLGGLGGVVAALVQG